MFGTAEQLARETINANLGAAGGLVQTIRDMNLAAGKVVAVREMQSNRADRPHPRFMQGPLFLIGNPSGRLNAGGRYPRYPQDGGKGHGTTSDLYLAMLHAVGIERVSLSEEDTSLCASVYKPAPLAELMA